MNLPSAEGYVIPPDTLRQQLNLTPSDFEQLNHIVNQLANWVCQRRSAQLEHGIPGAYTLGICGGQGSGKTTISRMLEWKLSTLGLRAAGFSLDDIYKTLVERKEMQRTCPWYPFRGLFGSHDVGLGLSTLQSLKYGSSGESAIPVFDKSLAQGQGGRLPKNEWRRIGLPLDVVVFEGWCVGAQPVSDSELDEPCCLVESDPEYDDSHGTFRSQNNAKLLEYQPLFRELSGLAVLHVPKIEDIHAWRLKQETVLRNQTGSGMDGKLVRKFVNYFIPSTIRYVLPLGENPAGRADLVFTLNDNHRIATIMECEGSTMIKTPASRWIVDGQAAKQSVGNPCEGYREAAHDKA